LVRVTFEIRAPEVVPLTHPRSTQTFSADKVCTRLLSIKIREPHDHLWINIRQLLQLL